jgi:hypothetical protein
LSETEAQIVDACAFPITFLESPWALVTFFTFVFLLATTYFSVPPKLRVAFLIFGLIFSLLAWGAAAHGECRSAEDTGGWNAPLISAITQPGDPIKGFPLSITNSETIPLKDVRITITKAGTQPNGKMVVENPFVDGQQINVGTVSPQNSPIRLNVSLPYGVYEISMVTSRGVFSERLHLFEGAGRATLQYYIRDQMTNKIVFESEPGIASK